MDAIKRLREMERAATEGPWDIYVDDYHRSSFCIIADIPAGLDSPEKIEAQDKADARLIAALRSCAPAILNYIDHINHAREKSTSWNDVLQMLNDASCDLYQALSAALEESC